ncbi:hypothetical protein O0L34_g7530 [Tuta absoluta]|nr:hypothetical protein O0L34_g7530 [Tuta absoluta]
MRGYPASNSQREDTKAKNPGCWAKFKSLFDDRGFDLEYEYNNRVPDILETQSDFEGYRRIDDRKVSVDRSKGSSSNSITNTVSSENLDGELSGVINFYEQFASLGDDVKEEELWKRSSIVRHRVSMRPSMYLTNIAEEESVIDEELEVVSF